MNLNFKNKSSQVVILSKIFEDIFHFLVHAKKSYCYLFPPPQRLLRHGLAFFMGGGGTSWLAFFRACCSKQKNGRKVKRSFCPGLYVIIVWNQIKSCISWLLTCITCGFAYDLVINLSLSNQELLTTFYLGFITLIFASFVLYMVEKDSNQDFKNWPSSFWWGIVSTSFQIQKHFKSSWKKLSSSFIRSWSAVVY